MTFFCILYYKEFTTEMKDKYRKINKYNKRKKKITHNMCVFCTLMICVCLKNGI